MDQVYTWLLMLLLSPSVQAELPPDTFFLVDPMDPMASSLFVDAVFTDIPDGIVTDLCLVESGGCRRAIGVHKPDAHNHSKDVHARATEKGLLSRWCPFYLDDVDSGYSTRGNHGAMFAYTAFRLGPCIPRDTMDIPLYSAIGTALRVREICRNHYNDETRRVREDVERMEMFPEADAEPPRQPCTPSVVRTTWAGGNKDPVAVMERWRDGMAFWRSRARWQTDWRGRCQSDRRDCDEAKKHRPTLAHFRRKARGKKLKW